VFANITSLPAGIMLDRYGSAKPLHLGSIMFALGCLLFGLSANLGNRVTIKLPTYLGFDGYIPAFITLGIGSATIFLSLLGIANFFPKYMSTILSFLNCSFDASVFVFYLFQVYFTILKFLIFKAVYEHTSLRIGTIFLGYSFIAVALTLCAFFWPKNVGTDEPMDASLLDNATEMSDEEPKVLIYIWLI
jgi:MFS family permease